MSELLDKQLNAQKEKNFRVHASSHKLMKKRVMKRSKQTRKKWRAHKNVIEGRKPSITPMQNTSEKDLHELQGNHYGYNEGTICLVNRWIGPKGMVFWAWTYKQVPLNSQRLVLRIGGADFLHCWVTDSILLENAKSLITKW